MRRLRTAALGAALVLALVACDDGNTIPTGSSTGSGGSATTSSPTGSSTTTSSTTSTTGATMSSSSSGMISSLDDLLMRLRADRDGTIRDEADKGGWPVLVTEGRVIVTENANAQVAGDFNNWTPAAVMADQGFGYVVIPDVAGTKYKLVEGVDYIPDPWARAYAYDQFGEITEIAPTTSHLERYFGKGDAKNAPRMIRVWVPEGGATRVLYAEDGQNLFDPNAFYGGWKLDETVPANMMIVGIDNTADRFEEYTHVPDDIGGQTVGGEAGEYAAFLENVVRPLVAAHYGEPTKRGLLGSSLGGLVSLSIANDQPGVYAFAASMSGTLGWGSIGLSNQTIIQRYASKGHQSTKIFLDSGGGGTCVDSDGDGTNDDGDGADNYCETIQMRDTLAGLGYQFDVDLFHWHEPDAPHNEAAWAARVFRPLQIFAGL